MQVMSIVETDDGGMTITCEFTQAEVKAFVEIGVLKLMEEYLEKNAPFHETKDEVPSV